MLSKFALQNKLLILHNKKGELLKEVLRYKYVFPKRRASKYKLSTLKPNT